MTLQRLFERSSVSNNNHHIQVVTVLKTCKQKSKSEPVLNKTTTTATDTSKTTAKTDMS